MPQLLTMKFEVPESTVETWISLPDTFPPKGVMYCLPGAFHSKAYYHLVVPGFPEDAYSFVLYMAEREWLVIAADPSVANCSLEMSARTHDAILRQISSCLRLGNLHSSLPVIAIPPVFVGVGHGQGGMLTIAQQALFDSYDALVILGWSNYQLEGIESCLAQTQGKRQKNTRKRLRPLFYASDVPTSVIEADEALAPGMTGYVGEDATQQAVELAEEIDIPIFVGFGEVKDVSDDAQAEVASYSPLAAISPFVLSDCAHCHNFAGTRKQLWACIDEWGSHILDDSLFAPSLIQQKNF